MPKRARIEQKKPVASMYDLLSAWQWRWLRKELLLWRYMPGEFNRLRAAPYPLDPATAALIEYLGAEHVLPWPVAQMEFERWLYPRFRQWAVQVEAEFNGRTTSEIEDYFGPPDLIEEFGLWPVVDCLPGDWPMNFHDDCEQHQQALLAAVEGTDLLRMCVRMPSFPLGGTLLSFLPLIEDEWIDAAVLALCDAYGSLTRAGYVRLESDDPHVLAWHRFFPKSAWWNYPTPCPREVFLNALEEARLSLSACPARQQEIAGRLHMHFYDYAAWEGRRVPGDLSASLFPGLWVEGWNAWVQDSAVRRDGLAGLPVGALPHPCRYVHGEDFTRFKTIAEAEAALEDRRREFAVNLAAAMVEAGNRPGCWPFSDVQKTILEALDGKVLDNLALSLSLETAEEMDLNEGGKQRTLYRELSLLTDMGLVVHDRTLGGYYRPDRPPTNHAVS